MSDYTLSNIEIERQVENWLTSIVIGLNLCPFANAEYRKNSIRFKTSLAEVEQDIAHDLIVELSLLNQQDSIETTLVILPRALSGFEQFNDFLGLADSLLEEMSLDGVFQIASFHPNYRFAETQPDDPENYTNRAPYPILHILRESSLGEAVEKHSNTDQIPMENIELMNKLGSVHMAKLIAACSQNNE